MEARRELSVPGEENMVSQLDDAKHWRFCAEELRTAADEMLSEKCRATALRIAEDYDRLAQRAEAHADHDRD
ncbi:MAG TPA: hypothetical protein VH684_06375 [Xanthobacteraceae bacterium]